MFKRNTKEQIRRDKRIAKLKCLLGIDFCACGMMYSTKCEGECRASHTDEKGAVKCFELYQVDPAEVRPKQKKRGKRRTQPTKNDGRRKRSVENTRSQERTNDES